MMDITILGGCYLRDFLCIGGNDDPKYNIKKFIQNNNVIALNSYPLSRLTGEILNLEGVSEHKSVDYWVKVSLEKIVFQELLKNKSDYLICGLSDVYHGFYKISNTKGEISMIDDSPAFPFLFSDVLLDSRFKQFSVDRVNFCDFLRNVEGKTFLDESLEFFENELLKIYNSNQIIFIQCVPASKYITKAGITKKFNRDPLEKKWLKYCDNHFIERVKPQVITVPDNVIADVNHKWGGPNPFHWIDAVYRYMFRAFEICVNDYYVNKELELSILYNDFERFLQGFWTRDEYLVSRYGDSIIDRNLTISNVIINFLGDNTKKFEILNISDKNAITEMPDYIEENGYSNIIKSSIGNIDISMKALEDGKMVIKLSGVEVKNEQGNFIPYWIDYKKWSINNHVILDSIHAAWYKRPIFINLEVKKNTVIDMHIEWAMHIDDRQ